MASKTRSGSTPALVARTKASDIAAMFSATMIWLASLVTLPAPMSPQRTALAPIFSSTSFTLSKTASLPPTMMASVPSMALGSPPETGASSISIPLLGELGGHLAARQRRDGAHVDEHASRLRPFDHAVLPQYRLLHVRRIGQHGDDELVPRGHVLGRRARRRAGFDQLRHRRFDNVVDDELVARLEEVLRHGLAHDAQSYEADVHFFSPSQKRLYGLGDGARGEPEMREQLVIALRRYAEAVGDTHELHGRVSDSPKRLHYGGTKPADHGMLLGRNDRVHSARIADHSLAVQRLEGAHVEHPRRDPLRRQRRRGLQSLDTMIPVAKIAACVPSGGWSLCDAGVGRPCSDRLLTYGRRPARQWWPAPARSARAGLSRPRGSCAVAGAVVAQDTMVLGKFLRE